MNKMTDIQRRAEEAMESILNIGQATPPPFFYTRLMARIQRQEGSGWEKNIETDKPARNSLHNSVYSVNVERLRCF